MASTLQRLFVRTISHSLDLKMEISKVELTTEWVCGSSAYSTMKPFAKRDSDWDPVKSWATTPRTKLTAPRR